MDRSRFLTLCLLTIASTPVLGQAEACARHALSLRTVLAEHTL